MHYARILISNLDNMSMVLENLDVRKRAVNLAKNIMKLCKDNAHLKNNYGHERSNIKISNKYC